jgi:ATP-dependent RNA helicase DDX3X
MGWGSSSNFGSSRESLPSTSSRPQGRQQTNNNNNNKKPDDDEFFDRQDVSARDPRLEGRLYGAQQNSGINFKNYDDIPVDVSGNNIPAPISDFENSELDPLVKFNIKLAGYSNPTPVQKHSAAIVSAGRDLMACAQTGSGKVMLLMCVCVYNT